MYMCCALAAFKYTLDQIRKMEESNQIRKAAEPTELIEMVRWLIFVGFHEVVEDNLVDCYEFELYL